MSQLAGDRTSGVTGAGKWALQCTLDALHALRRTRALKPVWVHGALGASDNRRGARPTGQATLLANTEATPNMPITIEVRESVEAAPAFTLEASKQFRICQRNRALL